MTVIDDIEELINRKPGLSEVELAAELFGHGARQQRVNPSCRLLSKDGRVVRRGLGGNGDPFRYFPLGRV